MTNRTLWHNIMAYGEFHRTPVIHWDGWQETLKRWQNEGMPRRIDTHVYFKSVPFWTYIGSPVYPEYAYLNPLFEERIIEETDDYVIKRNGSGVMEKSYKGQSSIPHFSDHTFKSEKDWPKYRERLQPDSGRISRQVCDAIEKAASTDAAICLPIGSMMGWLRDWMGVEGMTYLMYDSEDCFIDIVNTIADLACWCIEHITEKMNSAPDLCFLWEDICGSTGPFVSPRSFRKYIKKAQLRIRAKMREYDIPYLCIDSDGNVEALIEPWIEAGMDLLFPVEVGTWNQRPEMIRKKYGKKLRLIGGFNKIVLEKDKPAIEREFHSHVDLIKEGGFFLMPDHVITPDTPLENYQYYLELVRNLRF